LDSAYTAQKWYDAIDSIHICLESFQQFISQNSRNTAYPINTTRTTHVTVVCLLAKMPPSKSELYKKLSNSCGEDGFQGGPIFIPVDVMNNFITKDSIKAELGRTSGFWLNWSSYLADKVVKNNAKRIFAILLYIKEPWSIKKLLNDGFTDRDLPFVKNRNGLCFAHDTKKIFIPPEDWEDQTLDDFLIKQWIVLAPIFSISGKHLILNRLCPLPFSEEDEGNHSGSNVVYKIEVHRSHQKGFEVSAIFI